MFKDSIKEKKGKAKPSPFYFYRFDIGV